MIKSLAVMMINYIALDRNFVNTYSGNLHDMLQLLICNHSKMTDYLHKHCFTVV